jgi:DNA-binding transcriptional regulator PaaX
MRELKKQLLFTLLGANPQIVGVESSLVHENESLTYAQLAWRLAEFAPASIRGGVSSLKSDGAVTTLQRDSKTRIRLTTVGRELIYSFIRPSVFRRQRWDETWRIAIFSGIALSSNAARRYRVLRRFLQARGFAQLERAVYISPFGLREGDLLALSQGKALGLLTILETKRFLLGDEREWCRIAWRLDQISKQYTKLGDHCSRAITHINVQNGLNDQNKEMFRSCEKQLFQIMQEDIGLPSQLLPESFGFTPAWKNYLELSALVQHHDQG